MSEAAALPATSLRLRKLWIVCGIGFVLLVIFLSLNKDPPRWGSLFNVKIGHFLAYCWLMFWFGQIYRDNRVRLAYAVAFCAMGVALEFLQGLTGYRTFGYTDMRDNALGIATGFVLVCTPLRATLFWSERILLRITSSGAAG